MAALVWAGDWVAEELVGRGRRDEAARISLWVRNMACIYSEIEVRESLDGLDKEMTTIIRWLNDLEAGGLDNQERARIQGLFGPLGRPQTNGGPARRRNAAPHPALDGLEGTGHHLARRISGRFA